MRSRSGRKPVPTQLARSHSTGHSLAVRLDRDLERFRLRLPEHARTEMVVIELIRTCTDVAGNDLI